MGRIPAREVALNASAPVDVLVLGSGIAGLRIALRLADHGSVCLVTKRGLSDSNTNFAQGGISAVLGPDDSFEAHAADTLATGAGLCHPEIVQRVVSAGPAMIADLVAMGVDFDRAVGGGSYELGREGGHSHRRIVHAGDFTGQALERGLALRVRADRRIRCIENCMGIDLLRDAERVQGAVLLDASGQLFEQPARVTVLATGGSGKVYRYTSNPDVATGDGLAMAYRAGATLANLEFFQFHPTCLFHPEAKNFLLSEALRGEGALLLNLAGERFLQRHDARAELAPRDLVARAIDAEMKQRGDEHVLLDARPIGRQRLAERFPNILSRCLEYGMDLREQPVPVVPAAHYQCGGVLVDGDGASDLTGLFVIGEAACTGLHGANRLASNSLLEALYFAHAAAERIGRELPELAPPRDSLGLHFGSGPLLGVALRHDWEQARRTMWDYVGIVRDGERLAIAGSRLSQLAHDCQHWLERHSPTPGLFELRNVLCLGELMVSAAEFRRETRGLHVRSEVAASLPEFCGDTLLQRDRAPKLAPIAVASRGGQST